MGNGLPGVFLVNMTQMRVTWEEGTSTEEISLHQIDEQVSLCGIFLINKDPQ